MTIVFCTFVVLQMLRGLHEVQQGSSVRSRRIVPISWISSSVAPEVLSSAATTAKLHLIIYDLFFFSISDWRGEKIYFLNHYNYCGELTLKLKFFFSHLINQMLIYI